MIRIRMVSKRKIYRVAHAHSDPLSRYKNMPNIGLTCQTLFDPNSHTKGFICGLQIILESLNLPRTDENDNNYLMIPMKKCFLSYSSYSRQPIFNFTSVCEVLFDINDKLGAINLYDKKLINKILGVENHSIPFAKY